MNDCYAIKICTTVGEERTGSDGKHILHHKQIVFTGLKLPECQAVNNVRFYYNDGIFYCGGINGYFLRWYAFGFVNALNPICDKVAPKPECFLPLQGTAALTRSQQFQ